MMKMPETRSTGPSLANGRLLPAEQGTVRDNPLIKDAKEVVGKW
jgi:hypothetical protein